MKKASARLLPSLLLLLRFCDSSPDAKRSRLTSSSVLVSSSSYSYSSIYFFTAAYSSSWFDAAVWETEPAAPTVALPDATTTVWIDADDVALTIPGGRVAEAEDLVVGRDAFRASLTVRDSGSLRASGSIVVGASCCDARFVVGADGGVGGRVDAAHRLIVGDSTKGTYVQNGGETVVGDGLVLGRSAPAGTGFLHLRPGGTVRIAGAGGLVVGDGSKIELEGGVLEIQGDARSLMESYRDAGKITGDFEIVYDADDGRTRAAPRGFVDDDPEPNQRCDSDDGYCDFTTTFDIDFGDFDYLLDDWYAQVIFSFVATDWINTRNDCQGVEEVYYGFNVLDAEEDDKDNANHVRRDDGRGRRRRRRKGQASGKCRGKDCPRQVSVSAPNKRRRLDGPRPRDGGGGGDVDWDFFFSCESDLLEKLRIAPVFSDLVEIRIDVYNDDVSYETTNECVGGDLACSSAQRNATRIVSEALGSRRNESRHECLWEGVQCYGRTVTSVQLTDKKLSGSVPPAIGELKDLEGIFLSGNSIEGNIPNEIGLLQNIQRIELGNNDVSSTIPTELGSLEKLTNLYLENNKLSGTVPTELARLVNLDTLYLSGNDFSGDMSHVCFPPERDFFCEGDCETAIMTILDQLLVLVDCFLNIFYQYYFY